MRLLRDPRLLAFAGVGGATAAIASGATNYQTTDNDSTQPRGTVGATNPPVTAGFRAPAYRAGKGNDEEYADWSGSMMAQSARDPAFYAALSIANADVIAFANALSGSPADPTSPLGGFLTAYGLAGKVTRDGSGRLQPEALLPVAADFCLRCHAPVGWLEHHSEPTYPNAVGDQFWGATLLAGPTDAAGKTAPSQSELDGVQCDVCHRIRDNSKRASAVDGRKMPAGNGGYLVLPKDPFGKAEIDLDDLPDKVEEFQLSSEMCGTCHDVTNPMLKTRTAVGGVVPDMNHPIERTYTEWYWSDVRRDDDCKSCHEPMKFLGAQTWMLNPVMPLLWPDVDAQWVKAGYLDKDGASRVPQYEDAVERNEEFMSDAADVDVEIVGDPDSAKVGQTLTARVRIRNDAGHKLPTGYPEGRQMWIHLKVCDEDARHRVVFEDGVLDATGHLVRTPGITKVYEQVVVAEGNACPAEEGSHEGAFHFILGNLICKDNRIPPKGYDRDAYFKEGAFILPEDLYTAKGQNWDETDYSFVVPTWAKGDTLKVEATVYYQTFSAEYVEFLGETDVEPTEAHGGRARNLPPGVYADANKTWGAALVQLWEAAGRGPPVTVGDPDSTTIDID